MPRITRALILVNVLGFGLQMMFGTEAWLARAPKRVVSEYLSKASPRGKAAPRRKRE